MSLRVLTLHKPASSPSPVSTEQSDKTELARGHTRRRRRHTRHNHQDRLLHIMSRILMGVGLLMVVWLVLDALGWI
jgi:hypothetical protein